MQRNDVKERLQEMIIASKRNERLTLFAFILSMTSFLLSLISLFFI